MLAGGQASGQQQLQRAGKCCSALRLDCEACKGSRTGNSLYPDAHLLLDAWWSTAFNAAADLVNVALVGQLDHDLQLLHLDVDGVIVLAKEHLRGSQVGLQTSIRVDT